MAKEIKGKHNIWSGGRVARESNWEQLNKTEAIEIRQKSGGKSKLSEASASKYGVHLNANWTKWK